MAPGLLLKAGALVVFFGLMGGAAYGVQTFLGDDATSAFAFQVESPRGMLNVTGGHDATLPLVLHNRGEKAATAAVRLAGEGIDAATSAPVVVPARGHALVFLTLRVPDGLPPGETPLSATILDASGATIREKPAVASLRVLAEGMGFADGDSAMVRYTGRLAATGKVFDSNDPALLGFTFPATTDFQPGNTRALPVESRPEPSVIPGFFEGLLGMQPGETRTVTFAPEKGYGPATQRREMDRLEPLERAYPLELRVESVGLQVFQNYLAESGQGTPADYEPGDVFYFEQGPNRWPYRIVEMKESSVDYRLEAKEGDRYTLFPFWENASLVTSVNATHALFVTTPTTEVGEAFTMRGYWPDASRILSIDDETILVQHSPAVGFKFTIPQSQFAPAQEATVAELSEDTIYVAVASDHPLAGQSLTFDVELLEIRR